MEHFRRRLLFLAAALTLALGGGTLGFVIIEHRSPFEAFYFTLITITTVGYGEIFPLSRAGRIFNSFVILVGVMTVLLALGSVTQTAIELELNQYFGRRRVRNMIAKLKDHYIVCGFGRVGHGAAAELQRAAVPFVVIDKNEDRVENAMKAGMLAVVADSTSDATLVDAGIGRAQGLVATLSSDADNLFVLLSAKSLQPNLRVCARISDEASDAKFRRAGADFVFAPYDITGNRMAQALLKPHVFQFIDFTTKSMGLDVGIEQVKVGSSAQFVPRTLGQMQLRRELGVIVLAIRKADGRMLFNPDAGAEIEQQDYLVVMGEPANLRRLEERLAEADK